MAQFVQDQILSVLVRDRDVVKRVRRDSLNEQELLHLLAAAYPMTDSDLVHNLVKEHASSVPIYKTIADAVFGHRADDVVQSMRVDEAREWEKEFFDLTSFSSNFVDGGNPDPLPSDSNTSGNNVVFSEQYYIVWIIFQWNRSKFVERMHSLFSVIPYLHLVKHGNNEQLTLVGLIIKLFFFPQFFLINLADDENPLYHVIEYVFDNIDVLAGELAGHGPRSPLLIDAIVHWWRILNIRMQSSVEVTTFVGVSTYIDDLASVLENYGRNVTNTDLYATLYEPQRLRMVAQFLALSTLQEIDMPAKDFLAEELSRAIAMQQFLMHENASSMVWAPVNWVAALNQCILAVSGHEVLLAFMRGGTIVDTLSRLYMAGDVRVTVDLRNLANPTPYAIADAIASAHSVLIRYPAISIALSLNMGDAVGTHWQAVYAFTEKLIEFTFGFQGETKFHQFLGVASTKMVRPRAIARVLAHSRADKEIVNKHLINEFLVNMGNRQGRPFGEMFSHENVHIEEDCAGSRTYMFERETWMNKNVPLGWSYRAGFTTLPINYNGYYTNSYVRVISMFPIASFAAPDVDPSTGYNAFRNLHPALYQGAWLNRGSVMGGQNAIYQSRHRPIIALSTNTGLEYSASNFNEIYSSLVNNTGKVKTASGAYVPIHLEPCIYTETVRVLAQHNLLHIGDPALDESARQSREMFYAQMRTRLEAMHPRPNELYDVDIISTKTKREILFASNARLMYEEESPKEGNDPTRGPLFLYRTLYSVRDMHTKIVRDSVVHEHPGTQVVLHIDRIWHAEPLVNSNNQVCAFALLLDPSSLAVSANPLFPQKPILTIDAGHGPSQLISLRESAGLARDAEIRGNMDAFLARANKAGRGATCSPHPDADLRLNIYDARLGREICYDMSVMRKDGDVEGTVRFITENTQLPTGFSSRLKNAGAIPYDPHDKWFFMMLPDMVVNECFFLDNTPTQLLPPQIDVHYKYDETVYENAVYMLTHVGLNAYCYCSQEFSAEKTTLRFLRCDYAIPRISSYFVVAGSYATKKRLPAELPSDEELALQLAPLLDEKALAMHPYLFIADKNSKTLVCNFLLTTMEMYTRTDVLGGANPYLLFHRRSELYFARKLLEICEDAVPVEQLARFELIRDLRWLVEMGDKPAAAPWLHRGLELSTGKNDYAYACRVIIALCAQKELVAGNNADIVYRTIKTAWDDCEQVVRKGISALRASIAKSRIAPLLTSIDPEVEGELVQHMSEVIVFMAFYIASCNLDAFVRQKRSFALVFKRETVWAEYISVYGPTDISTTAESHVFRAISAVAAEVDARAATHPNKLAEARRAMHRIFFSATSEFDAAGALVSGGQEQPDHFVHQRGFPAMQPEAITWAHPSIVQVSRDMENLQAALVEFNTTLAAQHDQMQSMAPPDELVVDEENVPISPAEGRSRGGVSP
jgi:hypothetical protein